jgi:hypothetical protein
MARRVRSAAHAPTTQCRDTPSRPQALPSGNMRLISTAKHTVSSISGEIEIWMSHRYIKASDVPESWRIGSVRRPGSGASSRIDLAQPGVAYRPRWEPSAKPDAGGDVSGEEPAAGGTSWRVPRICLRELVAPSAGPWTQVRRHASRGRRPSRFCRDGMRSPAAGLLVHLRLISRCIPNRPGRRSSFQSRLLRISRRADVILVPDS